MLKHIVDDFLDIREVVGRVGEDDVELLAAGGGVSESILTDHRVLPNADVKIFQVASVEKRAERRYKENQEKGIACNYEDVVADVEKRDRIDSSRAFAPLKPAEDAIHLDTSDLTIDEVVDAVNKIIDQKLMEKKNA